MQTNILRGSNITKIYLIYTNSKKLKKRVNVKLRYMGDKECYFSGSIPVGFEKPKRKSPVELIVYTSDGIYNTTVKILDSNLNVNEVMYQLEIPKTWRFSQLRSGSRRVVALPGCLKFNDGTEISFETTDLSIGGFSFTTKEKIPSIYQRFSCICTLEFSKELIINFPDCKLETEVKFVRSKDSIDDNLDVSFFALKFVNLADESKMILKNYLLGLE